MASPAPDRRTAGRWLLAATILGSGMVIIDGTAVNVALPGLQRSLDASIGEVQWVVEAYVLTLSALMLVGGALGDRYGRRLMFAIGIGAFAVASGWCSLAGTAFELIIARGVQGVAGALLVPGSLALITGFFPAAERSKAIGTWAAASALMAVAGPALGGWLVDAGSWRAIFYINLPLAVITLAILLLRVPRDAPARASGPLDWLGGVLATLGLGTVVFGFIESERLGIGNPLVLGCLCLGGGAVLMTAWVLQERRARVPLLPLELFRSRAFSGANLFTLFLYAAMAATLFFYPLNLVQVRGFSATQAGLALLPLIAILSLLSRGVGGLMNRTGPRVLLVGGSAIAAAGYLGFALIGVGGSYWTTFFPALSVLGLGMALCVTPLTTVAMASAPSERAGIASGINNAISRVASLLAIACLGALFVWRFRAALAGHLDALDLSPDLRHYLDAETSSLGAMDIPSAADPATAAAVKGAIHQSFVSGFRLVSLASAGLAVAAALTAAVTTPQIRKRIAKR
jgi:EmrB/QacA subfamily drug resistance transporter